MRPLTKMSRQIVSAASIPTHRARCFRVAVEERPGPVHLELPEDIAAEDADAAILPIAPDRSAGRAPRRRSTAPPR